MANGNGKIQFMCILVGKWMSPYMVLWLPWREHPVDDEI